MRIAGIVVSFSLLLVGLALLTIGIMAESAGMNFLGAPRFMLRLVAFFGSPGTTIVVGLVTAIVGFFLRLWMSLLGKAEAK